MMLGLSKPHTLGKGPCRNLPLGHRSKVAATSPWDSRHWAQARSDRDWLERLRAHGPQAIPHAGIQLPLLGGFSKEVVG